MDKALSFKIGADVSDLQNKLTEAQGSLNSFKEGIGKIAGAVGLAFGAREVGSFALEITKLAGQADGVKQAFDKLHGSEIVLNNMKLATRGTVTELDLMKSAVQAQNFGIPIQNLANLFEFANERAKATGQSVDYLTDSIVTGIGRKSPLILDNLGISAVALKEKLHGVSVESASIADVAKAVGEIASEAMAKTGTSAETAADKIAKAARAWEEFKEALGTKTAIGSGAIDTWTNFLERWTQVFSGKSANPLRDLNLNIEIMNMGGDMDTFFTAMMRAQEGAKALGYEIKAVTDGTKTVYALWKNPVTFAKDSGAAATAAVETIRTIQAEISRLKEAELDATGKTLSTIQAQIVAENKKLEALKNQYALQQDARDSALLAKAGDHPMSLPGVHGYNVNLPLTGGIVSEVAQPDMSTHENQMKYMQALSKLTREATENQEQLNQAYVNFGTVAASAIGTAIGGHQDFGQAIKQSVPSIIAALGALAIAQITAAATSPSSNGGNYYVAVGLIAAGVALVSGIFAGLGNSPTSSASSGNGPSWSNGASSNQIYGQRLAVGFDVTFQPINGTALQAVLTNQQKIDNKVKGG